jgi:hypothetical protein
MCSNDDLDYININNDDDDDAIIFLICHDYTYKRIYLIGFVVSCRLHAYSCLSLLFIQYYKKHQMRMKNKMGNVVRQMTHNKKGN